MKFYRAYIEITNVCGLACTFCPPKSTPSLTMELELFENTLIQLAPYTDEIALHLMGDPLTLSNLVRYLDIARKHGVKVMLTTSGFYLERHPHSTLLHPAIRQLNISLNSFNKNDTTRTLESYLDPIIALCRAKQGVRDDLFINLRLWNLDDGQSEKVFNTSLFTYLEDVFKIPLDILKIQAEHPKSIRLDRRVLLHFEHYFQWPSLQNEISGDGYCHALSSQVGILASGDVVPCCLDGSGIMTLGNLKESPLKAILENHRAKAIIEGFKKGVAAEELCHHCSYKTRFTVADKTI